MLISRLINYSDTWIYSSQINHSDLSKIDIETGVKNWVSNLFPYLTEQGKKEFRFIIHYEAHKLTD